jgi:LAO/AO transport system kinase
LSSITNNQVELILSGDRAALARVLTEVENDTPAGRHALDVLFKHSGRAHMVGVTGGPGTGKSSLVNQLASMYRRPSGAELAQRVAIIAVDPSSPFSGGAILGDRIRMRDLAGDPGVFIRSMASRGAMGGLAHKTLEFAQIFDAAGFDVIIIETVGAGQAEVEIASLAHTVLVVEAPGLGDDIQAIKAGILEIADILVVNKADLPGAEKAVHALRAMLELARPGTGYAGEHRLNDAAKTSVEIQKDDWNVPVVPTVAVQPGGTEQIFQDVQRHLAYLRTSGEWQRREQDRLQRMLIETVRDTLEARWRENVPEEQLLNILDDVKKRHLSISDAVQILLPKETKL